MSVSYSYDALDRLTEETASGQGTPGVKTYEYEPWECTGKGLLRAGQQGQRQQDLWPGRNTCTLPSLRNAVHFLSLIPESSCRHA